MNTAFLLMPKIYSTDRRDHTLLIHSSVDGPLGCFCFLAIANSTAVNLPVQDLFEPPFSVIRGHT